MARSGVAAGGALGDVVAGGVKRRFYHFTALATQLVLHAFRHAPAVGLRKIRDDRCRRDGRNRGRTAAKNALLLILYNIT